LLGLVLFCFSSPNTRPGEANTPADPLLPAGKGQAALISADDPVTTAHGGIEGEMERLNHFVLTYIHFEDII